MVPLAFVDNIFSGVHRHRRDFGLDLGLPLRGYRLYHKLLGQGNLYGPPARIQDSPHRRGRVGLLDSIMSVFS